MMIRKRILPLLVGLIFVFNLGASAQTTKTPASWNPQRTWVFFVGLLQWENSETFASFPQKDRRDVTLLNVLRADGVPENQIVYLKDSEAKTAKIQSTFEMFLAKAKEGDWVIVYFCGHGYRETAKDTFLVSYDTDTKENKGWKVTSVPETIDKFFHGSNAVIMLDNCYSGAMADAVRERKSRVSYAVLASSRGDSSSTANWTYTESLIYAFRGEPFIDDNADGKITLGEINENSEADMEFGERQISDFAMTGNFSEQTVFKSAGKANSSLLGTRVKTFSNRIEQKGIVTGIQNKTYKVHHFGDEYDEDSFFNENQLIRVPISRPIKIGETAKAGEAVEAEWKGVWYPAKIVKVQNQAFFITYDGYGSEWDEWVPLTRLRKKATTDRN